MNGPLPPLYGFARPRRRWRPGVRHVVVTAAVLAWISVCLGLAFYLGGQG